MRSVFAAATLALVLASSAADARPRHRHHHRHHAAAAAISGRPAACAGIPWCGCFLKIHLGINVPGLNLDRAIEWASVGSPAPGPGRNVIAVWRHHVGIITEYLGGDKIRMLSGNDDRAVRERVRSTRGIVAYRHLH